jgi:hypothetical protein
MTTLSRTEKPTLTRPGRLVGWGLLAGGVFFFAGGAMHPKDAPDGVSLNEYLRFMYEDPAWYPSQSVLFIGMALIAAALVALARGRSLAGVRHLQTVTVIAALTASLATVDHLLRLVSAVDADAIAAGRDTPITDVQLIMETITVPAFCLGIIALAIAGARTRALGNPLIAVPAVLGGVGYGLASATVLLNNPFDPLFPTAAGIALWAIAVGWRSLLRTPATIRTNPI